MKWVAPHRISQLSFQGLYPFHAAHTMLCCYFDQEDGGERNAWVALIRGRVTVRGVAVSNLHSIFDSKKNLALKQRSMEFLPDKKKQCRFKICWIKVQEDYHFSERAATSTVSRGYVLRSSLGRDGCTPKQN